MKRKSLFILITALMLALTGCGADSALSTADSTDKTSEDVNSKDAASQTASDAGEAGKDGALFSTDKKQIAAIDEKIFIFDTDGTVSQLDFPSLEGKRAMSAVYANDNYFILYVQDDEMFGDKYYFAKFDASGTETMLNPEIEGYNQHVALYEGNVYLVTNGTNDDGSTKFIAYGFDCDGNEIEVSKEIDDIVNMANQTGCYPAYHSSNYGILSMLSDWGYMVLNDYNTEDTKICDKDGYVLYSIEGSDNNVLWIKDKVFYHYEVENQYSQGNEIYRVYALDLEANEDKLLYEKQAFDGPYMEYYPGIEGFRVVGDKALFVCDGPKDLVFAAYDLESGDEIVSDMAFKHKEYTAYGNVLKNSEEFKSDDGQAYYYYTVEYFQFDDSITNYEKINAILEAYAREQSKSITETATKMDEDEKSFYLESGNSGYDSCVLSAVKKISDKYYEVDYEGYEYSGGAHGMPYKYRFLFDVVSGAEVKITDIIDKDKLIDLAAQYSVKEVKKYADNSDYAPFYPDLLFESEEELYQEFKDSLETSISATLEQDAIVIEYYPYEFGPYAAGFIEVRIPIEETGIEL